MPEGAGTGVWAAFARDLRDGPAGLARASRRAFHLALLALAAPGLPLGALYLLSAPAPYPAAAAWGFAALGLGFGLVALRLARQAARDTRAPAQAPGRAALTAAMQAASAPAIPFLLGCAALHQPLAWGLCWAAAAALYLLARTQLPAYARAAGENRAP
ncbi:hypothetical protein [Deinococcus sp. Leaf326]|uniref:hypothetical protein n=1 Tax=Deinococcus sp. Leaf326 TaxID=1736338 RepID=UPI0006FD41EF|nr:hypothetical protein [Deinococcus sp. Leaf326]KQR33090.1 hypothetical protein ASF71_17115 [Deinococcus sp. Leaf326]